MEGPLWFPTTPLLAALSLGLLGSLVHCVGMCGGVMAVLGRAGVHSPRERAAAHFGRMSTYTLFGAIAGVLGHALLTAGARRAQGLLALGLGLGLLYMALAVAGLVPPPERHLVGLSRLWRERLRRAVASPREGLGRAWLLGAVWGLLPCGFVYTALLAAAASATPAGGGLTMLAFGLGTWPALEGIRFVVGRLPLSSEQRRRTRWASSGLLVILAAQMAMRGLAAWGVVAHGRLGGVMLW
ncbi:MAG: sulfite exporter TauE/SafE family protein [Ardenticatenia bacterium]|nr:sulfite exporter TauE/SafE family protein [Ardenticatenia bacterium]